MDGSENDSKDSGSPENSKLESELPILFWDDLPSNFDKSKDLLALAALLDECEQEAAKPVRKSKRALRRKDQHPYARTTPSSTAVLRDQAQSTTAETEQPAVSVGEASLFLSMWKL